MEIKVFVELPENLEKEIENWLESKEVNRDDEFNSDSLILESVTQTQVSSSGRICLVLFYSFFVDDDSPGLKEISDYC